MNEPLLIIPDVHGRPFWEDVVERYPNSHVVFLGDYLDPYPNEGISTDDAGVNFQSIVLFKNKYKERVTLLLGNHDLHYIDTELRYSRKQSDKWMPEVLKMYSWDNYAFFDLAYYQQVGEKDFLLTHAGILPQWWKKHFPNTPTNAETIADTLNTEFHKDPLIFSRKALEDISINKGGGSECGSCLWAHIDEHRSSEPIPNVYQIFGHTQVDAPIINMNYADIDCHQAFLLDALGNLYIV